jgi:hypothetical protein
MLIEYRKKKNNQFKEFSIHVNIDSRIKIVLEHVIAYDILEDEEEKTRNYLYISNIYIPIAETVSYTEAYRRGGAGG